MYVTLDKVGIRVSSLGFGCASILGAVGATQARRALEAAFEAGIRHFDLARSYGFGDAEQLFGEFARGKRSEITITTKFGILPSQRAARLAFLKPAARVLFDLVPGLRRSAHSRIGALTLRGNFEPAAARRSVEKSLLALGTDHVDFLLMHDCRWGAFDPLAMQELAAELKQAGKIRAFGVATSWEETRAIAVAKTLTIDVAQVGDNFLQWPSRQALPPELALIRHSVFRFNLEEGDQTRIAAIRRLLSEAGFDATDHTTWSDLSLALALQVSRHGPVICSMFDPRHISRNVEIANGGRFPPAVLTAILQAAS